MFEHMQRVLNVDKKVLMAQFACKLRGKSFEPSCVMI